MDSDSCLRSPFFPLFLLLLASLTSSTTGAMTSTSTTSASSDATLPTTIHNKVIVGGGRAGVNLACMLQLERPCEDYMILERSSSLHCKWRDSRWQGFQLNTPVKYSRLYGQVDDRDHDLLDRPIDQDLQLWDKHIPNLGLRYKLHSNVIQVTHNDQLGLFRTLVQETSNQDDGGGGGSSRVVVYESKNLVVCNGMYNKPKIPTLFQNVFPETIKQHVPAGLTFDQLKPGNVLIVGSGQSGCQISDLLCQHMPGIKVYLSTSAVPGCPRSFQGRDLFDVLDYMNLLAMPRAALDAMPPEKRQAMRYAKSPVTGPYKEISPFSLARRGVVLLGSLDSVKRNDDDNGRLTLHLKENRAENLKFCRDGYDRIRGTMLKRAELKADDAPEDPDWENSDPEFSQRNGPTALSTDEHNITNIIWCTGWSNDFTWLTNTLHPSKDDTDTLSGSLDVVCSKNAPGLFYCGFPWIGSIQSQCIVPWTPDAQVIIENLA